MENHQVKWPRVQKILHRIMERWEQREGRNGVPGIHQYRWDSPEELALDRAMGKQFIESGIRGDKTNLVISLRTGFGNIPKMPMSGPFVKPNEIEEIVQWIDCGMPE